MLSHSTHLARRLAALLLLLLLTVTGIVSIGLASPTLAVAAEKATNTDLSWGIDQHDQDREADIIADLKARWVRIELSWSDAEPTKGSYDQQVLKRFDRSVNLALAAGAKVLIVPTKSPSWASGSTSRNAPPLNPADYARYARDMAKRYAGKASAVEIWNEENHKAFWTTGPNPAKYAQLLKAAAPAVRAANPDATVLFGGLAFNDHSFLEGVYAAAPDIGNYFDAMAAHPYTTGAAPPEEIWKDANGRIAKDSFPGYRELRKTMLAHGDDKPIWLTEFGWATFGPTTAGLGGVTEATQAEYIVRAYKFIEQDIYVKVAFVYTIRNSWWLDVEADTWEDQLGMTHQDFTPKLSYNAFKGYVSRTKSPPAPVPAPRSPSQTPTSAPHATAATHANVLKDTSIVLRLFRLDGSGREARVAKRRHGRLRFELRGRVRDASSGRVRIRLQRRVHGRWRSARTRTGRLSSSGRFRVRLTLRRSGKWRVKATFSGSDGLKPSASGYRYFRVPRA
jgi:hypothetical protein